MTESLRPQRPERAAVYVTVAVTVLAAVAAVVFATMRIAELSSPNGVSVVVPLGSETARLALGPGGSAVEVGVEEAEIRLTELSGVTAFALYAEPIWTAATTIAGAVLAGMFFMRLARGKAFSRGSANLAYMGSLVVSVSWAVSTALSNIVTNGTLQAISEGDYEGAVFEFSLAPFLLALALGATGLALSIGEKLQRETEGLV